MGLRRRARHKSLSFLKANLYAAACLRRAHTLFKILLKVRFHVNELFCD